MQLTSMSWDFKTFILVLGCGYIAVAWTSENYILPRLGKYLGSLKTRITRNPKKRKEYKFIMEAMQNIQ